MAFLITRKPPSSSSPSPSSSSYGDENKVPSPVVTSCLYLKPDAGGAAERRSLDREVVLRRIRHRKRVNRLRTALQSLLKPQPAAVEGEGETNGWQLHDAFSSP